MRQHKLQLLSPLECEGETAFTALVHHMRHGSHDYTPKEQVDLLVEWCPPHMRNTPIARFMIEVTPPLRRTLSVAR